MSQISKKPVSLPLRKRLRPTVNLNVAGRRRNNIKDVTSLPDGVACTEPKTTEGTDQINVSEGDRLDNANPLNDSNSHNFNSLNIPGEGYHNTSFESRVSVTSTASTLILPNGTCIPTSKEHEINHSLDKSIDSTASTVLISLKDRTDVLEKAQEDILSPNCDLDDSRSVSSSISTIPANRSKFSLESNKVEGKIDNNFQISDISSVSSIPSNVSNSKHQEKLLGKGKNLNGHSKLKNDTLDRDNCDVSNSVSEISPATDLNCSNADSESVISDDRSSVYSFTSGSDKLPYRSRRRDNSVTKWLTDAKKKFSARFVDKKPERSSLRMLDLIYYNPTTNPMKSTSDSPQEVIIPSNDPEPNRTTEEDVDEPEEQDAEEEEENNRVPAPRVKVGPNGEIVLDEQSLVIETTQSKKSRKEIANLTVVVDSGSNTTYHTYSKKKRRRCDWSIQETVRFYKALQSIGTDFSLMQPLFPSRSRLDLKAKFKKEERINGHLIEKALRFPSLFDLSELEKEQENESGVTKKDKKKDKKGRKRSLNSLGFDEHDQAPAKKTRGKLQKKGDNTLPHKNQQNKNKKIQKKKISDRFSSDECQSIAKDLPTEKDNTEIEAIKNRPKRISDTNRPNYAAMDNGDDSLDDVSLMDCCNNESDEEEREEGSMQMDVVHVNGVDLAEKNLNPVVGNNIPNNAPIALENFSVDNVQPGSIVLLTTECPDNPGYQICNVFMVQDNPTSFSGDTASVNADNYYSFPSNEISSSVIDIEGATQPS